MEAGMKAREALYTVIDRLRVRIAALEGELRELSEAAWPYAASQDGATDPRVGLVQPITKAEARRLGDALEKADEALGAR